MRILGIDPGLGITGYGIIDADAGGRIKLVEAGVIRTSQKDPICQRLHKIFAVINDIILTEKPSVLVLEKIYSHYKHPVTSILMAHARGVVCLVCGINSIKLVNYSASRIKKAITGRGNATKEQVKNMIM